MMENILFLFWTHRADLFISVEDGGNMENKTTQEARQPKQQELRK